MCPQGRGERTARRAMADGVIDRVLDGLAAHRPGAGVVLPFWNGEPLLTPAFDRFLDRLARARAAGARFDSVSIHTHGGGLTPERSERILASGLFSPITVSLDAATPATYARIRRGGELERVVAHLDAFLEMRQRRGGGPRLVLQFIAMAENREEARPFVDFWRDRLARRGLPAAVIFDDAGCDFAHDTIFIRRLIPDEESPATLERVARLHEAARRACLGEGEEKDNGKGNGHETEEAGADRVAVPSRPPAAVTNPGPAVSERDRAGAVAVRRPCPGIFSHLGVVWDGRVSPCCRDFEAQILLGSVLDTPLPRLWTGERLRDHRLAHIDGRFHDVPRCGDCPGQPFGAISDGEIVAWLKSVGREDRIHPYLRRTGAL